MEIPENKTRYLYWLSPDDFEKTKHSLSREGYSLSQTLLTPCQVLNTKGKNIIYAPPSVWSRLCVRQGSWYRGSARQGNTMLMSDHKLPAFVDPFLDSEMSGTDFIPEQLPTEAELESVAQSEKYQKEKPEQWEKVKLTDKLMIRGLFAITRFWKLGEKFKQYWTSHKANHANFISRQFTTEIEGEQVPYSVSENAGVCSSCVEFFNVLEPESRKLVRACPGAIIFGDTERDIYYDVKPNKGVPSTAEEDPGK